MILFTPNNARIFRVPKAINTETSSKPVYDFLSNLAETQKIEETNATHRIRYRRQVTANSEVKTNYDSTSIRRPFDCLSKVIKVTVT